MSSGASTINMTVIVTGANCGIGYECAKELCKQGYDVVMSVRDKEKGDVAVASIKSEVPDARVMYIIMELSEPFSIRAFVAKFHETGKSLHVLINNAGFFPNYSGDNRHSARGNQDLELSMIVNCMGTFLLTNLLLDDLKATGTAERPSRIVNVSSSMTLRSRPEWGKFNIDDLMISAPNSYKCGAQAYKNSKIALNLWSNHLAKNLVGSNVVINTLCPGFIPSTNLGRDVPASWSKSVFMWVMDSFIGRKLIGTKPVHVGRDRVLEVALDDKFAESSGKFYKDGKVTQEAPEVLESENQDKIWDLCVKYSGLN